MRLILLVGLGLMCSGSALASPSKGVRAKESVTKQLLSYVPANGRITLKKTIPMSRLKLDEFRSGQGATQTLQQRKALLLVESPNLGNESK